MGPDADKSLSNEATLTGRARPPRADVSIGDERTIGDGLSTQDTIIDDIDVVDLAARYRVEGELGQGGMGAVLLAVDTRLDRKVAIKRIFGDASRSQTAVSRFLTEAKSIAALSHPNIVVIYDCHSALQNRPRIVASKPVIGWVILAGIILLCGPIGKWPGFSR